MEFPYMVRRLTGYIIKDLKILQVTKYNARVEYTNERIRKLKNMTDLEPEVEAMIQGLVELDRCNVNITNLLLSKYNKYR